METMPRRTGALEWAFLIGLGGVFLVNAIAAAVRPADFESLIASSALGPVFAEAGWLTAVIGVNDLVLGVALVAAGRLHRYRGYVLAWAGLWLLAVSVIKLTSLG